MKLLSIFVVILGEIMAGFISVMLLSPKPAKTVTTTAQTHPLARYVNKSSDTR